MSAKKPNTYTHIVGGKKAAILWSSHEDNMIQWLIRTRHDSNPYQIHHKYKQQCIANKDFFLFCFHLEYTTQLQYFLFYNTKNDKTHSLITPAENRATFQLISHQYSLIEKRRAVFVRKAHTNLTPCLFRFWNLTRHRLYKWWYGKTSRIFLWLKCMHVCMYGKCKFSADYIL